MTDGHGDDIYHYKHIKSNFSSNVCHQTNHDGLKQYLYEHMDSIRAYPEPEPFSLERNIAAHCGIEPEHVCATNGATEAIYLIAQAYRESHSFIKMPTFSEYADACRLHAHQVHPIYDLNRFPEKPVLIWLCNPNNPTGEVYDINLLKQLIENYPQHLFILDQSYEAFTLKRIIGVKEALAYPNVLQLHSMTKQFAVPGLRIGYVTGHPLLIGKLRKCRMPWSVNALAIAAGQYLLNHAQEYQPDIQALLKEKDRVAEALKMVDRNILKLDSAIYSTFHALNRPVSQNVNPSSLIYDMKAFEGQCIVQTLFVRGEHEGKKIDNTTDEEIEALINAYKEINPQEVMVYSIDRQTPEHNLTKVPKEELEKIGERIKEAGINVQVNS